MYVSTVCSVRVISTRAEWPVWWVHSRGQGARVLSKKTQVQEGKINSIRHETVFIMSSCNFPDVLIMICSCVMMFLMDPHKFIHTWVVLSHPVLNGYWFWILKAISWAGKKAWGPQETSQLSLLVPLVMMNLYQSYQRYFPGQAGSYKLV